MIEKTCAFTGHRLLERRQISQISYLLRCSVVEQIQAGVCCFASGGALGFDTLAALTVLDLSEEFPHVKLMLVLPCENQDRWWPIFDRERYKRIKERANEVVVLHKTYINGCMQERNRYLVDHASRVISYLNRSKGGTYYTVQYAKKANVPVYNIADRLDCENEGQMILPL